jgi:hypothetical protein
MFVVDYCKGKMDFGRVEIDEKMEYNDPEGYFDPEMIAAMTACDLEREGYEVIIKEIEHGKEK